MNTMTFTAECSETISARFEEVVRRLHLDRDRGFERAVELLELEDDARLEVEEGFVHTEPESIARMASATRLRRPTPGPG